MVGCANRVEEKPYRRETSQDIQRTLYFMERIKPNYEVSAAGNR